MRIPERDVTRISSYTTETNDNPNPKSSCSKSLLPAWSEHHRQWLNYSTKGGGSLFPGKNSNMTGDTCVSVTGNILRVHTHNTSFFKVPYHKSVKQKKWLSALGWMQRLDDLCLLLSTDIVSTRQSESSAWHWWIPTIIINNNNNCLYYNRSQTATKDNNKLTRRTALRTIIKHK